MPERPLHIAFLDSWLQSSAQGSGTAVGINGLQDALSQLGHRITRISPSGNYPKKLFQRRLWFNAHLPHLLRRHDFDLIVGFDIDGFLFSVLGRDVPFICSIKGVAAEEALQESGTARVLLASFGKLENFNARHADLVLTTSRYCRDAVQRHYRIPGWKIGLVPEGINLPRWQKISQEMPRQGDGFTILCVARQYRRKRVKDLLRALTLVRRDVPQVHAVIIGDGPEHGRLRRLVRELQLGDIVQLLGEIPDDDEVARHYRRADIFCLPTIQEGFGIVFLEAMAAGLPIVSTTAAAIPEVVPHDKAGLLVRPRQVRELAAAITRLLREPEQRQRFGAFGQEHVRQFDWPAVAPKFLAQVERLPLAAWR